jgi:hypothetical protein
MRARWIWRDFSIVLWHPKGASPEGISTFPLAGYKSIFSTIPCIMWLIPFSEIIYPYKKKSNMTSAREPTEDRESTHC